MSKNKKDSTEPVGQDSPVHPSSEQSSEKSATQPTIDTPIDPLAQKDAKITELTHLLQHKQAEFENYQKRMEKWSQEQVQFAGERFIQKIVPIYDNFALSLKHKENVTEFITGVQMIEGELKRLLSAEGLVIQSLKGKLFDPRLATAIATTVDAKAEPNTVLEEVSPCYLLHGKVIKHAKVIVSKREDAK